MKCETFPLWNDFSHMKNESGAHLPSCYRRLKLFSNEVSKQFGGRIVSLDLDVVITGDLSPLWDQKDNFLGWRVPGVVHPQVFNGSMWMFRAGTQDPLWSKFVWNVSPTEANKAGYFGSDQAWISYKIADKSRGWTREQGVLSYPREQRRQPLHPWVRVVIFHGKRKPWDLQTQKDSPWIADHWRL